MSHKTSGKTYTANSFNGGVENQGVDSQNTFFFFLGLGKLWVYVLHKYIRSQPTPPGVASKLLGSTTPPRKGTH